MESHKELEKKVDKILTYLHNDSGTGQKGLVAAFTDHEKKFNDFLNKYELEQEIKRARMGVWGAVGGAVLTGIVFMAKSLWAFILEHSNK